MWCVEVARESDKMAQLPSNIFQLVKGFEYYRKRRVKLIAKIKMSGTKGELRNLDRDVIIYVQNTIYLSFIEINRNI